MISILFGDTARFGCRRWIEQRSQRCGRETGVQPISALDDPARYDEQHVETAHIFGRRQWIMQSTAILGLVYSVTLGRIGRSC